MKRAIRDQWLTDLRSNEFEQGRMALAQIVQTSAGRTIRYCCLGVLCERAYRERLPIEKDAGESSIRYGDESAFLPVKVMEWAGLAVDPDDPDFRDGDLVVRPDFGHYAGTLTSLAALNDHGYTFHEIADLIEEQVPVTDD